MLDLDGGGEQSSSFTTQIETTEGLTLGKGTEDEVSVTAQELGEMKQGGGESKRHNIYVFGDNIRNADEVKQWLINGVKEFYIVYDVTAEFDGEPSLNYKSIFPISYTAYPNSAWYILNGWEIENIETDIESGEVLYMCFYSIVLRNDTLSFAYARHKLKVVD